MQGRRAIGIDLVDAIGGARVAVEVPTGGDQCIELVAEDGHIGHPCDAAVHVTRGGQTVATATGQPASMRTTLAVGPP